MLSPKEWHMIGPRQGLANHGPRPNLTAPLFFVCPTNSNGFFFFFNTFKMVEKNKKKSNIL